MRDLKIAKEDGISEVRFTYAYQALLKSGIALLAKKESVKVRSTPGHHVAVITKMSEILKDEDINILGHRMRVKRNRDLYDGGDIISAGKGQRGAKAKGTATFFGRPMPNV